jgi:hypothetical protein
METLARWAGYLAIAGGAIMAVVSVVTTVDPTSPAWVGFFVVPVLLGAAVIGFQERTRPSTGQLGWASAWLSAAGVVGLLLVFGWSVISGEGTGSGYTVATDPLIPLWIATAGAWFVGNLGFAVALIRGRALSRLGAWLVLAGALIAVVITATLAQNLPPAAYLLFAVFGIGWAVVGYAAVQPRYRPAA